MKRMIMMMGILLIFATVVKANYYITENTTVTSPGDATTVEEERIAPTVEPDEITRQAFEPGNALNKSRNKEIKNIPVERKTVDSGTMPATQTEDISTEAKYDSYANYENATLAKKSSSATFRMAQLYFRDGLYEKAVNLALKDEAPDIPVMYVIAIGSRLMGNNEQSIDYYSRILSQDNNQAEAKLGMGIAYKSKGEFSKALGYLKDYARINPSQEVVKQISELNELISSK